MNDVSLTEITTTRFELKDADVSPSRSSNSTPRPRETNGTVASLDIPIKEPETATMRCEEYDISSNNLSKSNWNLEETNNLGSLREAKTRVCTPRTTNEPVRILVVGPSGGGKTCTITNSYSGTQEPRDNISHEATTHTKAIRMYLGEQMFELIDTPGFDNACMSDTEAFAETANYLLNPERVKSGITGIIYVHRAGNPLHNRSLLRNFRVLTNVFLGKTGIARLAFLVTQSTTQAVDYEVLVSQMAAHGSAFNAVFSIGAKVATFPNEVGFVQLLQFYASHAPIMLPIQLENPSISHVLLMNRIEKELGYYEFNSVQSLLDDKEQQLRKCYEQRLVNLKELEAQLRQKLHQSQSEYSSLRSQLQLQENVEQSQVVQKMKDINRMIEDIGRSVSAYLTDNHVQPTFGRDAAHVNPLHSRDLSALTTLFCHRYGGSSLIASSTSRVMHIEEFLDYSIRNFLCRFLFHRIFRPFHPEISPSLNKTLIASYDSIQKREPQSIAGKWRSETFKSLGETSSHEATEAEIDRHFQRLLKDLLGPLIKGVFGKDIPLEDVHSKSLRSLVKMAWGWNSHLKSDVIMLGDFVQTYFPRSRFDAIWMEEFEATSPEQNSPFVLGTLALGLACRKAAGRGNPIEEIVVCKAVVVTKNIFN